MYLVVWDPESPRLGSSFIWPQVRAFGRWSTMTGTQVIGSNRSQEKGLKGQAQCSIPFTGPDVVPKRTTKNSPLASVL